MRLQHARHGVLDRQRLPVPGEQVEAFAIDGARLRVAGVVGGERVQGAVAVERVEREHPLQVDSVVLRREVEQVAEARDPGLVAQRRPPQRGLGDPGLAEARHLLIAQFLDAKVGRVAGMRIDQDGGNARASQHRSGSRAGEAAPDDRDIRVFHRAIRGVRKPHHCARNAKESLS